MRALLIDTKNRIATVVEINDRDPEADYYKLINCKELEVDNYKIGGVYYEMISDAEEIFVDTPKVSVLNRWDDGLLAGNVIVRKRGKSGELQSLSDVDVARIHEFIDRGTREDPITGVKKPYIAVSDVDY